jgi:tetratricopeptide (TPR) repeat protein
MRKLILAVAGVVALAAISPQMALAAGEGGQSTTQPKPQPTCKKGYVYSQIRKKCIKLLSEAIPDADLKTQGWALTAAGEYEAAIELFRSVANPRDPEALNGLGYSHRKSGMVEEGIRYYRQAIAIDPEYVRAREYLGEGYVALGKTDLAKAELAEIEKRCGKSCEEYVDLAEAIAGEKSD